jgi:hypothetical protein
LSDLPFHDKVCGQNLWMPRNVRLSDTHFPVRCTLAGQQSDAVNALLAAVGYNFSLLLKWLRQLLCLICWLSDQFEPVFHFALILSDREKLFVDGPLHQIS